MTSEVKEGGRIIVSKRREGNILKPKRREGKVSRGGTYLTYKVTTPRAWLFFI